MKTIGFVSRTDPFKDRTAQSGSIYKVREAIEIAGFKVEWIPYSIKKYRELFWNIVRGIHMITIGLGKKYVKDMHFRPVLKEYAKSIKRDDNYRKCDYLFFFGGTQILEYFKTNKPIVEYTDATFHQMINYYWFNICKSSIRMGKELEEKATNRACINIRASHWAINSVINDCRFNPKRSYVLQLGPTLDIADIVPVKPYESGTLNVLFSGVVWKRKGGDIAVDTIGCLREKGIDAQLYIVGIKKLHKRYRKLKYIHHVGYLNKNNPQEYKKYIYIWEKCHIFLLPTRAECSAIVFSEAVAFGLPSYTYNTGGLADYVFEGKNGRTLELDKIGKDFADVIYQDIIGHKLSEFHKNCFQISHEILSWNIWAKKFHHIMEINNLL